MAKRKANIDASRCVACGVCRLQCPREAISIFKGCYAVVNEDVCVGCGLCTTRCEFDAIHLTRDMPAASDMHTAEEMMKLVGPYALKRMGKIIKRKLTGKGDYPAMQ